MNSEFNLKVSEPKFYSKIKVQSKICLSENFVEYRYKSFSEDFVGLWRKVGGEIGQNPSTAASLQCSSCLSHSDNWPRLRGIDKPVSFQSPGLTRPFNKYAWNVGTCKNSASCWGDAEYLFEVKRMGHQYQFTHKKIVDLNLPGEEVVARYNAALLRKYRPISERHLYEGISLTSRRLKMFYPNILKDDNSSYYIYIRTQPNTKLPSHKAYLYDVSTSLWPDRYKTAEYLYPNTMTFEYFLESRGKKKPETICDLDIEHQCVGRSFLELYPGGGGMKVTQYCHLSNSNFDNFPSPELKAYHEPRKNRFLIDDEPDVTEAIWMNKSHVGNLEAFVPGLRDGLAGPIISYFARVDNNRRWFVPPNTK